MWYHVENSVYVFIGKAPYARGYQQFALPDENRPKLLDIETFDTMKGSSC